MDAMDIMADALREARNAVKRLRRFADRFPNTTDDADFRRAYQSALRTRRAIKDAMDTNVHA